MGNRRQAREWALKILYESELQKGDIAQISERVFSEESLTEDVREFLARLLLAYQDTSHKINEYIEKHSENWKMSRMSVIDRSLLRLGVTEILLFDDIPKSVSINEYLELAKKFGTQDSKNFINGILDKI